MQDNYENLWGRNLSFETIYTKAQRFKDKDDHGSTVFYQLDLEIIWKSIYKGYG